MGLRTVRPLSQEARCCGPPTPMLRWAGKMPLGCYQQGEKLDTHRPGVGWEPSEECCSRQGR